MTVTLEVNDTLYLSDPCVFDDVPFDLDTDTDRQLLGAADLAVTDAAGTWTAAVQVGSIIADFGDTVRALIITRAGVDLAGDEHHAGHINIDTGTAVAIADTLDGFDFNTAYLSLQRNQVRPVDGTRAVVSPTGLGDGGYDVYVTTGADGRPARVRVDFAQDDDEPLPAG